MFNQIAEPESEVKMTAQLFMVDEVPPVQCSFRRCIEAMKSAPKSTTRSEKVMALCMVSTALLTAFLPLVVPHAMMRLSCTSLFAVSLAVLIGRRLAVVQFMSQRHVYLMLGMMAATFMLGLSVAIILSEGMHLAQL